MTVFYLVNEVFVVTHFWRCEKHNTEWNSTGLLNLTAIWENVCNVVVFTWINTALMQWFLSEFKGMKAKAYSVFCFCVKQRTPDFFTQYSLISHWPCLHAKVNYHNWFTVNADDDDDDLNCQLIQRSQDDVQYKKTKIYTVVTKQYSAPYLKGHILFS